MKSHNSLWVLVAAVLFCGIFLGPYAMAGSDDVAVAEKPLVLPLQDYMGVLLTVDVTVGQETLPFIFDTGGGLTVITTELTDRLGLTTFGRVTGFRMSGERVDLPRCPAQRFDIGPMTITTHPNVFDVMGLLPDGWPVIGGLVSLHTFQDHPITIDLRGATVTLETEASLPALVKEMRPLAVRFSRQASGSSIDMLVEVQAETGTLWMEVDSGNAGPIKLAPHALDQLGIRTEPGQAWSGVAELEVIGLGQVRSQARESELIYDGVLNVETLKQMILTIDHPSQRAWAKLH